MKKPRKQYAIIKTPIVFGTKDINIPELVVIENEVDDLILIHGNSEPIKRKEIWRRCTSKAEAIKIIKKAEELQLKYDERLADIGYEIGEKLEAELSTLIEAIPEV